MPKKILMVLMGLEIGGAETHVVELSRELHRQGYEVVVVSNGGVYESELIAEGIRCYHAPLHQRKLTSMLKSLLRLRSIIRKEKPDMVHAHARIPAFLCGILHKMMQFPFVTTAHWVFYVNPLLRHITNWGERTIAVSEDIRDYLHDNYGVSKEKVIVTINGIDTEKFSAQISGEKVRQEFGIAQETPLISYVSRMDESRALVARQLVEIAPRLCEKISGLRLLIAGGGDIFDEILATAKAQNERIGYEAIIMTGARTDINEIVAAGDLFVGVSRAALEAMAAEKPVIVAGNEGYIGLFDESKKELAKESNFCCRGCPASTPEALCADVLHTMTECSAEERTALGRFGREMILSDYSVHRMAGDCLESYRLVWAARTRVVVSGYYGFRNLGDDAILFSLRDKLAEVLPGAVLVVLSRRPQETKEKYGVASVHRFHPFAVLRELKRANYFLSGGGSLLQDHTSTRSLVYYTALIRLAKWLGCKVLFYANGIGPVRSEENRNRVRKAAECANWITLRDRDSLSELRAMGVKNRNLFVTADPVYGMGGIPRVEALALLKVHGVPIDRPMIGISVRFADGAAEHLEAFAHFCDSMATVRSIVFFVMQQESDREASDAVRRAMKRESFCVESPYDPKSMIGMLSCMDAVVSTRLHGVIFSACAHVPMLGIVYDPKVESCLAELGMPSIGDWQHFSAEVAEGHMHELLSQREVYRARLDMALETLRERSVENDRIFLEFLELPPENGAL